jgi:hypothetical protein
MNAIKFSRAISRVNRTDWYISDFWPFHTLTLMMDTMPVSEMLVFNSALTRLIARKDFIA